MVSVFESRKSILLVRLPANTWPGCLVWQVINTWIKFVLRAATVFGKTLLYPHANTLFDYFIGTSVMKGQFSLWDSTKSKTGNSLFRCS